MADPRRRPSLSPVDPTASGDGDPVDEEEFDDFEEFELDDDAVGAAGTFFDSVLSNPSIPVPGPAVPEQVDSRANPEDDGIDLRSDQRMAIEIASDGIENKTFYEILLLPRSADDKAIKRAYYKLSKEYHPDKFYRKQLGPYKEKLEVIFNKVNEAYRVLSDLEGRGDYDMLVFGKDGKDAASPTESTATVNFVPDSVKKKNAATEAKKGMSARAAADGGKVRKGAKAKFLTDFQKQLAGNIARSRKQIEFADHLDMRWDEANPDDEDEDEDDGGQKGGDDLDLKIRNPGIDIVEAVEEKDRFFTPEDSEKELNLEPEYKAIQGMHTIIWNLYTEIESLRQRRSAISNRLAGLEQ